MAEVLEFNEMFYTNFEPKMKNRFIMNIGGIAARCRLCELLIQPLLIQTPKTAKLVDQRRSSEAVVEVLLRQQSAELHVPVVIHLVVPVVTGNGCDQTQGSCI